MAGFLPHPKAAVVHDVAENEVEEDIDVNSRFYIPHPDDKGKSVIRFKAEDLLFLSSMCDKVVPLVLKQISPNTPKCKFVTLSPHNSLNSNVSSIVNAMTKSTSHNNNTVDDRNSICCIECKQPQSVSMTEHFLMGNRPCNETLKCPLCIFIAPTSCSLWAHIRVHKNLRPFVCPECGTEFDNSQTLYAHMRDVCFHLAKRVRFKCPAQRCRKLFSLSESFTLHFYVHFKTVYYCTECKLNLYELEEKEMHTRMHESKEVCFETKYKCTVCSAGCVSATGSKKHIEAHTREVGVCVYVYTCRWCKSNFRSAYNYDGHIQKCSKRFDDKRLQVFNLHKNEDLKGISKRFFSACVKCNTKFAVHLDVLQQYEKCVHCNAKIIIVAVEQQPMCDVVGTSKIKAVNTCLLCKVAFPSDKITLHAKKCKYSRPVVNISAYDKSKVEHFKRATTDHEEEKSAKKRKNTCNTVPFDDVNLEAETPKPFDGTYRCKFCNFARADRTEFHDHVKAHKELSTAYQCMECGDCFVVKLSLTKHLMHFHKILDIDTYFRENDCYDKEAVAEQVKENQCSVCMQQFSDERELNNHFRIHGMAFLMYNLK